MSILLLADIHSNLDALNAVFADAEGRGPIDAVWCLGDLVGYGPDPSACLRTLRAAGAFCVAGNHDLAAVGEAPISAFTVHAAAACRWTASQLSQDDAQWLGLLSPLTEYEGCTLVHGSPRDPLWEYMATPLEVRENFSLVDTPLCLFGHTHLPSVFIQGGRMGPLAPGEMVDLSGASRLFYNPGSVGQPRDGDPRAAYGLYDARTGTITHHRVEYDLGPVQARMQAAGLPPYLVTRLGRGR